MRRTLEIENVAQPYAQRSKEGVMWWLLTISSFLVTVVADIATLALVWWFTQNGTSIERLQNVEDIKLALLLSVALVGTTFALHRILRMLIRRVTDSIPGATGVVTVDKLPGLQAPGFFISILPHTVWMITILAVGKHVLDFSPVMLGFVLLGYYMYALRSLGRAITCLTVARNRFGTAALVLAGAMLGFAFPILGSLTPDQIVLVVVILTVVLGMHFMLRQVRYSLHPYELGMTYRLPQATTGVARAVKHPLP